MRSEKEIRERIKMWRRALNEAEELNEGWRYAYSLQELEWVLEDKLKEEIEWQLGDEVV